MDKKIKRNKVGKKAKIITVLIICVLVVGGLGYFLLTPSKTTSSVSYVTYQAKTGNIETTAYGSGSITSTQTTPYNALAAGTGKQVVAATGDSVKSGGLIAVLDANASSSQQLSQIASSMTENYMALTKLYTNSSGVTSVYSPVEGRVKLINAKVGDDVSVDQNTGALCVISSDGDMYVDFTPAQGTTLTIDQKVKVEVNGTTVTGKVVKTGSEGQAEVLITKDTYDQGTDVKIYDTSGNQIGEGSLMINAPVPVVALGGYVSSLSVKNNSYVYSGTTLMKLVQTGLSEGYSGALAVVAPSDGILSGLTLTDGSSIAANALMFNLLSANSFTLTVSVDELDIANIKVGQSAAVTIDALPNETFKGTVQKVSSVGTVSSGVATYSVTMTLNDTTGVKPGMSASANIQTAYEQNAVLVPASAIITKGGNKYVMLASAISSTGTDQTAASFNSTDYVEVQTGITDGTNIEIVSGLTAGTSIAYAQSTSSRSSSSTNKNSGLMMDLGGGGTGGPPNGGGNAGGSGQ